MNQYRLIWAENDQELAEKVNTQLQKGWGCQGGVCFGKAPYLTMGEGFILCQAMVRDVDRGALFTWELFKEKANVQ